MRLIHNAGPRALDLTLAEGTRPHYRLLSATLRGGRVTLATLAADGAPRGMLTLAPAELRQLRARLAAAPEAPGTLATLDPGSDAGTRALATDGGGLVLFQPRGATVSIEPGHRADLMAALDTAAAAIETRAVPAA